MAASARVGHHIPGRLRIRIESARGNPALLNKIKQALSSIQGVYKVEAHSATGSFIIHYKGRRSKDFRNSVEHQGKTSGLYSLAPPEIGEGGEIMNAVEQEAKFLAAHSELARAVVEDTSKLDQVIKRATDNNLDLKVLVPLGLAIWSAFVFGAEIATPLWATLGIFSFNSFVALHPPLPYAKAEAQSPAAEGKARAE